MRNEYLFSSFLPRGEQYLETFKYLDWCKGHSFVLDAGTAVASEKFY